jgi:hypothetical protein
LVQAIASILEASNEQIELLHLLVTNSTRGSNDAGNALGQAQSTYADFLATHPPTFTEAGELLEADNWLHTIESKVGLLRCTENKKTLFVAQQLLGATGAWWAIFAATRPSDQVQWAEFREAFHAQHIQAGIMVRKHQEFMDLKQDDCSVYT